MEKALKRSLSLLLAITIIMGSAYVGLSEVVFGEGFGVETKAASESDLTFRLVDNEQSYSVTGCNSSASDSIVIPSSYNGLPVTSIYSSAFKDCTNLTSITIPDSVMSIGAYAFENCTNLISVTIPDGVTSIDVYAFHACTSFTSITIPDSVTSIGDYAFYECTSLTSITIPDSMTSVGSNAFYYTGYYNDSSNWQNDVLYIGDYLISANDTLSGSCEIKDGTKTIADYAFSGCSNLTSIAIPDSVTSIGRGAFFNCEKLTTITIPDSIVCIGDSVFRYCENLTTITIPDSVTSIGEGAFYECKNLTSITIPDNVTSIGSDAFYYCTSLTSITIPDSVTSIGDYAFYHTGYYNDSSNWQNDVLYIGDYFISAKDTLSGSCEIKDGTKIIADYAFYRCTSLTTITIPDSVTSIGRVAFYDCESLTSVNIPDSVTYIGDSVFRYCENLTTITIPDSVTSIGEDTFYECKSLTSITIPDNVTSIGSDAFYYCTSLNSITIPDSVTSIGDYAFCGCISLTDVYYGGTETEWNTISIGLENDYLINSTIHYESVIEKNPLIFELDTDGNSYCVTGSNDYSITEISIPEIYNGLPVTTIGYCAFENCTKLSCITIPDSVKEIALDAFSDTAYYNNTSNWVDGVLYIGNHLIKAQESISGSYIIKNNTKTIANSAFNYCSKLTSVQIPNSVTNIGVQAFGNCTNLTSITIPDGIISIPYVAFENCGNLESVIIPESVTSIGDYAFSNCKNLKSITIPDSVTNIGYGAFTCCESLKSITIPDSVTSIDDTAFYHCLNLASITMSNNVTYMGGMVFEETAHYEDSSNWENDVLYIGNHLVAAQNTISGDYTIEEGTKSIVKFAFRNCTNLTSVSIPKSVTTIGCYAFDGCDNLASVTITDSILRIEEYAFADCARLKYVFCTDEYFDWEQKIIVDNNEYFENAKWHYGATGHTIVKNAAVAATCTTAGKTEGSYCSVCNTVIKAQTTVPATGHTSSDWIINNETNTKHKECTLCGEVLETQAIATIVDSGICGENITWKLDDKGVLTINGTGDMTNYSYRYSDEYGFYSDSPFYKSNEIKSVVLTNGITRIGSYVFAGCTNLTSITIPDSVTSIGNYAFYKCSSLTTLAIPESVKSIGFSAFDSCESLAYINIPIGVTIIDEYTFSECANLTSITIPDGVTSISYRAFYDCTHLTSITIPDSVTSIGYEAFYNCTSLKDVYYKGSATDFSVVSVSSRNEYLLNATWHYAKTSKPATPKVATTNEIGGVQVKWNAVDGATKYVVYRRQGGYKTWTLVGTTTGTTLLDKNVKSGIFYIYSVRAYNSAGQYSDFVSANTQTRKFMATPKLTGISNATNGLYIKWNAVAGITEGYRVYRRGAGSTYWTYLGTTNNLYFTDTQVKNKSGEYFRYTVIADGGYHSKFDTTGLYLKRLANPTLSSAVSSKSGITVKWGAVKGTTGYNVYRKTANSNWVRVATVSGTNTTTYLDKTPKKGTTYTYTVRAVCGKYISYYNSGISCRDKY